VFMRYSNDSVDPGVRRDDGLLG